MEQNFYVNFFVILHFKNAINISHIISEMYVDTQ